MPRLIEGLGPCNDNQDRRLRLDPERPVVLLVHGCRGSAGNFRALADVFALHGKQAACFSYDDRDNLETTAKRLRIAMNVLLATQRNDSLLLIGHSQGALVARWSASRQEKLPAFADSAKVRLVTISGPFAGIQAASHCGNTLLGVASFGLTFPICHLVTGAKWVSINPNASFIQRPAPLAPQIDSQLAILTDEGGSCRRFRSDGRCAKSDSVFNLAEQSLPRLEPPRVVSETIKAGHVEIVGDSIKVPHKLLASLEAHGFLPPLAPDMTAFREERLREIYGQAPDPAPQKSRLGRITKVQRSGM